MKSGSLACLLLVLLLVAAAQECRAQEGKATLAGQQAASAVSVVASGKGGLGSYTSMRVVFLHPLASGGRSLLFKQDRTGGTWCACRREAVHCSASGQAQHAQAVLDYRQNQRL